MITLLKSHTCKNAEMFYKVCKLIIMEISQNGYNRSLLSMDGNDIRSLSECCPPLFCNPMVPRNLLFGRFKVGNCLRGQVKNWDGHNTNFLHPLCWGYMDSVEIIWTQPGCFSSASASIQKDMKNMSNFSLPEQKFST